MRKTVIAGPKKKQKVYMTGSHLLDVGFVGILIESIARDIIKIHKDKSDVRFKSLDHMAYTNEFEEFIQYKAKCRGAEYLGKFDFDTIAKSVIRRVLTERKASKIKK